MTAISLPTLDPRTVTEYGKAGQNSVKTLQTALDRINLQLTYEPETHVFTIPNSHKVDESVVKKVIKFNSDQFSTWFPRVIGKNHEGLIQIKLGCSIRSSL